MMTAVSKDLAEKAINTIRFMSADAIEEANSGHPGLPMGTAAMAYTLWTRHLIHNPANPGWVNRDRFVLSGGHGSMLLYSLLHLSGYDLPLSEIKNFRQWGSQTPGHPEYGVTPGVETTTGPLGQGFANGVGMAITGKHLAALFNRPEFDIIDYRVYGIVTDGDLMEGIASEAASLAGHLHLDNLVYLYDDNRISIDGSTELTFTEDRALRFESYGWHVIKVADGNNLEEVDQALQAAKSDPRPSLVICRTHIGYGLPTRQDTKEAHGEPPGEEELNGAKRRLGWPLEPRFLIPGDVSAHFDAFKQTGMQQEADWREKFDRYREAYPEPAGEFTRRMEGALPEGWQDSLPDFPADPAGMATRKASGAVINALAPVIPELIGGSADLAPSNKTLINGSPDFQSGQYEGRNFHFGVREHGMGGIINGMALAGGVIPYGGTFLVFSDYMRAAVRLSALSHIPAIWIYTHDSIGLGEDGPTHQPVEQLAALRAIPNLINLRPADANEVVYAWKIAVENRRTPTALILTRQSIMTLDRNHFSSAAGLLRGAYILKDPEDREPELILIGSGSEVELIVKADQVLEKEGISARLVSMPSWELFSSQEKAYREEVFPPALGKRLAVEAGVSMGWERWVGARGDVVSVERFGASAPGEKLYQEYGLTVENIVSRAKQLLEED
jgi:transketolase